MNTLTRRNPIRRRSMNLKQAALRALSKRRSSNEGMTLIEIMIVVVIMALIATAVGVAVLPQFGKAKTNLVKSNVSAIAHGVESYILNGGEGCPSVQQLIEEKEVKMEDPTDPWGNEYEIECNGDEISVRSAGADGEFETEDDVSN